MISFGPLVCSRAIEERAHAQNHVSFKFPKKRWVHAHKYEIITPKKNAHISFRQVSHQRGKWKQVARVPGVDSFRSSFVVFARFKFKKMALHHPFGQTMTTFWKIARKLVSNIWKKCVLFISIYNRWSTLICEMQEMVVGG